MKTTFIKSELPGEVAAALDLVQFLSEKGYESYLVGGVVRDLVMGREPHDADITTAATPEQVQALFPDVKFVGAHFGVSRVPYRGFTFEVATFRTDGAYGDGRRPDSVAYTTDVREDLLRRDFTMNALLLDKDGQVIDHVFGLNDIRRRKVSAVGSPTRRFAEDGLRMLRAIRFVSRLRGFTIEEATFDAIQRLAPTVNRLSAERIQQELTKILLSGDAMFGLDLLQMTGLLARVLPEIEALRGVEQPKKHHPEGDVWNHTFNLLAGLPTDCSPTLAWAALLHDTGKPGTAKLKDGQNTFHGHEELSAQIARTVLTRLKFSNDFIETVVTSCAEHMRFRVAPQMRRSKLLRFMGQPNFEEMLHLHYLDAMGGSKNLTAYNYVKEQLAATPEHVLHPVRLVTGDDLRALGITPGPIYRTLLEAVADAQLEGTATTRDQAMAVVAAQRVALAV